MSLDRTWGETRDCRGCRYWSERLTREDAGIPKAACVAAGNRGEYRTAGYTCAKWESGELGAVDDPTGNPYAEAAA